MKLAAAPIVFKVWMVTMPPLPILCPPLALVIGGTFCLAAGFKDWSIGDWTQFFMILGAFITATLAPFFWTMLAKIKEIKQMSTKAAEQTGSVADKTAEITTKLDHSADRAKERDQKLDEIRAAVQQQRKSP